MPSPAESFAKRIAALITEVDNLSEASVKRALVLLEGARKDIASQLAMIDPDTYTSAQLIGLRDRLKATVNEVLVRYHDELDLSMSEATRIGNEVGDAMLSTLGLQSSAARRTVEVLQGLSTEMVSGLGAYTRRHMDLVVSRLTLGAITPAQAVKMVAAELPSRSVFTSLESRAEAIVRTETNRAFSIVTQTRISQVARQAPGLKKQWVAVMDSATRPTHAEADGQVVGANEPFVVGDYTAQYPRSPELPPEESVNCRCQVAPVVDEEALASAGIE